MSQMSPFKGVLQDSIRECARICTHLWPRKVPQYPNHRMSYVRDLLLVRYEDCMPPRYVATVDDLYCLLGRWGMPDSISMEVVHYIISPPSSCFETGASGDSHAY